VQRVGSTGRLVAMTENMNNEDLTNAVVARGQSVSLPSFEKFFSKKSFVQNTKFEARNHHFERI